MCFAMPVLANAGTPLMWASGLHLLVGNAIIGVGEGLLIVWLFGTRRGLTVGLAVAANYFSMLMGMVLFGVVETVIGSRTTIYTASTYLWGMMAVAYLATILMEWPFLWVPFWKHQRRFRFSLLASVVAQTFSYALLIPFYFSASQVSLLTDAKAVKLADFPAHHKATVYYISAADDRAYRQRLDGSPPELISSAMSREQNAWLTPRLSPDGKTWDLWVESSDSAQEMHRGLTGQILHEEGAYKRTPFGGIIDLRRPDDRTTKFWAGFWAADGLRIEESGGRFKRLAFETPFLQWRPQYATVLPSDQVVCQFGDQIVLFDLPTMKIALLARGRGPLVVMDE